jgi:hypothetical protein
LPSACDRGGNGVNKVQSVIMIVKERQSVIETEMLSVKVFQVLTALSVHIVCIRSRIVQLSMIVKERQFVIETEM